MAGKADVVAIVAGNLNITKVAAAEVLQEVIDAISKLAVGGERVQLQGFGSFAYKTSAARKGRNPQTGAVIDIPAKNKLTFKASK